MAADHLQIETVKLLPHFGAGLLANLQEDSRAPDATQETIEDGVVAVER